MPESAQTEKGTQWLQIVRGRGVGRVRIVARRRVTMERRMTTEMEMTAEVDNGDRKQVIESKSIRMAGLISDLP
jgi:hypothetical protein